MDRRTFYDQVRHNPFPNSLDQKQVDGMEALLDEGKSLGIDRRWLAYILGTAFHETARRMQPIEEFGKGAGRPYGRPDPQTGKTYYGRGFVQLTWKANYRKMGEIVGVDLVSHPEKALDLKIATKIIFEGMIRGSFSGRKLAEYLNASKSDWYHARKIVNGLDRAELVDKYSKAFYRGIVAATSEKISALTPPPMPDPDKAPADSGAAKPDSGADTVKEIPEEINELLRSLGCTQHVELAPNKEPASKKAK